MLRGNDTDQPMGTHRLAARVAKPSARVFNPNRPAPRTRIRRLERITDVIRHSAALIGILRSRDAFVARFFTRRAQQIP
jgi:hypothetical protein